MEDEGNTRTQSEWWWVGTRGRGEGLILSAGKTHYKLTNARATVSPSSRLHHRFTTPVTALPRTRYTPRHLPPRVNAHLHRVQLYTRACKDVVCEVPEVEATQRVHLIRSSDTFANNSRPRRGLGGGGSSVLPKRLSRPMLTPSPQYG